MIRKIHLRQWRCYETLELELGAGTTFVVAANGVGKTSLVLGLGWAVFGEHSRIDAQSCIRAGADEAVAEVELALSNGQDLIINRRVRRKGRPKVKGTLDGVDIDNSRISDLLEQSFGVDLDVAARLSLMLGGGHLASGTELDLKSHLYEVFGADDLIATSQLARDVAKQAEKQRGAVRVATETRLADRENVEGEVTALLARLKAHGERGRELQDQVRFAEDARQRHVNLEAYREQQRRYDEQVGELLDLALPFVEGEGGTLDRSAGLPDAIARLRMIRDRTEREASGAADAAAEAKGTVVASRDAIDMLSAVSALCPTCLRPIGPDERDLAFDKQERRRRDADKAAEEHAHVARAHRSKITAVSGVVARMEALRPPSPPEAAQETLEPSAIEEAFAAANAALELHHQELGAMNATLQHLRSQIASDDRIAEGERELHVAYRREALTSAAAEALSEAVAEITERSIAPVGDEVRSRWGQLFPGDGLTLRPDGTIVRIVDGQELGWDTLSGGERIWARVVTHLLVLASFTRLPFAWFDEPLEHLDPQLRHTVAATLAAVTQGAPKQLLVTTYENRLVHQLAEDTHTASVITVRPSVDSKRPAHTPKGNAETPGRIQAAS